MKTKIQDSTQTSPSSAKERKRERIALLVESCRVRFVLDCDRLIIVNNIVASYLTYVDYFIQYLSRTFRDLYRNSSIF